MKILVLLVCLPVLALTFDYCSDKPNGVYEPGCKTFLKCVNGTGIEVECLENMVYNSNTGKCDDPKKVPAPCGDLIDCTLKHNGHYVDFDQGCHTYYTCNGGSFFGHNFCPAGLVFNEAVGVCDWPQNAYEPCGLLPKPPTTVKPTTKLPKSSTVKPTNRPPQETPTVVKPTT